MSRTGWEQFFIGLIVSRFNYSTLNIPQAMAENIEAALSQTRLNTYRKIAGNLKPAINLYLWNANISCYFLFPLHVCEVVIRNAVSNALTNVYGEKWPWDKAFALSLPDREHGYNPRKDLQKAAKKMKNTGKVIPELKFIFWQDLFTRRNDMRIWDNNLLKVIPNIDRNKPISELRENIYNRLDYIRVFRNRIAHHEPIINRNLREDYDKILETISFVSLDTAKWVDDNQQITTYLNYRP